MNGLEIGLHPHFLKDFGGDLDALGDFLENLHPDEHSIIAHKGKDLKALKALKMRADQDVDNSAKALAIEG